MRTHASARRILLCGILVPALLHPPIGAAQSTLDTPGRELNLQGGVSCDEATRAVLARTSAQPQAAIYQPTDRDDADAVLRSLSNLGNDPPGCGAAFGVRGLVKWTLVGSGWPPKDAPGQRAGVPWNADAVYDLTLAGEAGGRAAAGAGIIAVRFLLADGAQLPWLVREVGQSLLRALAIPSDIPDSTRELERGRLAAWLGATPVADSAFSAYRAAGGDAHRAALELGRVRLAIGAADGAALYYEAASSTDARIIAALRADIALIADSAELAAFDALGPSPRAGWLREFWERRDLESLKPRGARLSEHYARMATARAHFRLLTYPRRYELNELWVNRDAEFDDRGLIFIRHGAPDDSVSATRAGACPNSSWLYRRSDGNLIFHFVARENPDDWRLVESLANVGGGAGATTRVSQASPSHRCAAIDGLLESRARLDPIYRRLAVTQNKLNWERELDLTTRSREVGTTTDSDPLRYPKVLDVAWRAYGLLGGAGGSGGRVLLLVSVPARSLTPISTEPIGYGFRMRVVARSGAHLVEIDTVRRFAVRSTPGPDDMITFTTELPVPAGIWRVGTAIEQPVDAAGQFFSDGEVTVPSESGGLALSDIVLGAATGGRPWTAPDGPFPLSPTGSYFRGEPVPIYYEVAGAAVGGELETEITFTPEEEERGVTVGFR
ncbi:MAG TPA: GWxTD domain-containing protein, partial [Gemmatimonadales bacterium]|nr:GWxTD domain-containing protein [Gemmatimonadales bacterium]